MSVRDGRVFVTIARIESKDPCIKEYAQFLSVVRGPHPSAAYVKRQLANCARWEPALRSSIETMVRRMSRRTVFATGRRDRIDVEKIWRMRESWGLWIFNNVLDDQEQRAQAQVRPGLTPYFDSDEVEDSDADEDYEDYDWLDELDEDDRSLTWF